jgi:hypothetical protein
VAGVLQRQRPRQVPHAALADRVVLIVSYVLVHDQDSYHIHTDQADAAP